MIVPKDRDIGVVVNKGDEGVGDEAILEFRGWENIWMFVLQGSDTKKKALCNEKKFCLYWLEKRLHHVQVFIGKNIQL